jgi:ribosomal protein S4E
MEVEEVTEVMLYRELEVVVVVGGEAMTKVGEVKEGEEVTDILEVMVVVGVLLSTVLQQETLEMEVMVVMLHLELFLYSSLLLVI